MALVNHHKVVLVDGRHGGRLCGKQRALNQPLNRADMDLGLRLGNDIREALQVKNIGEGARPDYLGGAEFAGALLAKRITVHDEADAAEAFGVEQAVKKSDRELRLAGAGRHGYQHLPTILAKGLFYLLDGAALVGSQREAEGKRLGLQRFLGGDAIGL